MQPSMISFGKPRQRACLDPNVVKKDWNHPTKWLVNVQIVEAILLLEKGVMGIYWMQKLSKM